MITQYKRLWLKWYAENRLVFWSLVGIFIFGFSLRIASLSENLLFGFEQGRDALKAKEIYSLKDIVLIGPKTDLDGIFHGVWYYYLIAILYFICGGNPLWVTYILASINVLTIFVIYAIARTVSISKTFSLFAAALFAASFIAVAYSRWLSNVSPSIFTVGCFMLSLMLLVKHRKDWYWIPTLISFALLFHFELLHGLYACVFLVICTYAYKLPLFSKQFTIGLVAFALINAPFVVFDLKNDFILSRGLTHYLTGTSLSPNPMLAVSHYVNGFLLEVVATFASKFATVPFVLFFLLLPITLRSSWIKKSHEMQILILFNIWTFPYMFLLRDHPLDHFYAGTSISLILTFIIGVEILSKRFDKRYLVFVLLLIFVGMSLETYKRVSTRDRIFYHMVQQDMTYGDQKRMIAHMLRSGRSFEWEAFTIPYYLSDAYQYLLPWYGNQVVGDKISNMLSAEKKDDYYIIVEPRTDGIWFDKWNLEKDAVSKVVSEENFGAMRLQLRKKIQ